MNKISIIFTAISFLLFGAQAAYAGPAIAAITAIANIPIIGNLLISMAVNAITNKLFGKKGKGAGQERSILVNKQSNNEPIPVVYGRRRLGGVRAFIDTSDGSGGAGTNTLNMVVVLAEGECGDIQQLYFNDTVVWDASVNGTTSGDATNGFVLANYIDDDEVKYTSGTDLIASGKIIYHPGHVDQVADADLVASSADWTTNHRLRGIAYLAFKLPFSAEGYESGLPTMTAVIDGKKIRAATNPVGSATSGADANPADVILDYLTNDNVYGKGISDADIDLQSFADARTYCSTRFDYNGICFTGNRILDNLNEMLYACNGMLVYSNGKYKLKIKETGETATGKTNFNNENIIGDVTVSLTEIKSRFNKVTADYNNSAAEVKYNEDVVIVDSSSYLTQDSNKVLELGIELPYTVDETQVTTIATSLMDQSRKQMMIGLEVAHTVFPIEAGEIVTVTLDEYGFNNKMFRVITTELTEDNTIKIAAQEYDSSALI